MNLIFRVLVINAALATAASAETVPPALSRDYSSSTGPGFPSEIGLVRNGNSADNEMGGTDLNDAFSGAEGNDLLIGYDGFDTFSFESGDGADTIIDLSPLGNKIKFLDVPEDAVSISEVPGYDSETDRLITYSENDAIRIVGWSRLSDETKAAWTIEHFFRPRREPVPERPSPIRILLTNPTSLLLILGCLAVGLVGVARLLRGGR